MLKVTEPDAPRSTGVCKTEPSLYVTVVLAVPEMVILEDEPEQIVVVPDILAVGVGLNVTKN